MYSVLLIPVNDLISHPISTRFIPIAKRLTEKHGVRISMLRYDNIPTASKFCTRRPLKVDPVTFKSMRTKNIGSYYLCNSLSMFSALLRYFKKSNPDVIIHANVLPSAMAVGLGKVLNTPLIFDYQDSFPDSAAAYFKNTTVGALVHSTVTNLTGFNIRYSSAVVVVRDSDKCIIKRYDENKRVVLIPNGVDMDLFKPLPRTEALKILGMESFAKNIIMLYFGSIDPWIDFITPLKVIKRLSNKGLDIVFLVLGTSHSGWYNDEIRKVARSIGVEDRLFLLSPVPQERLIYYINAADFIMVPYKPVRHNYGASLKILESLACGKDVIVARIPEILDRFKGVVHTYISEQELESTILRVVKGNDHPYLTEKRRIAEKYSWDSIASSYYELIKQIAAIRK